MEKYLFPFLLSFTLSIALLWAVVRLSGEFSRQRREAGRAHKRLSRFGGIALALSFVAVVLFNGDLSMSIQLLGLLLGSVSVLVFGFADDVSPIPWWGQFLFQSFLGALVFAFGMRAWTITNPFGEPILLHPETAIFPSLIIGMLWLILAMNAINWADGVDGLLGGVTSVTFLTIFFLSFRPEVNQPAVAILAAISVGLSVGFLIFNLPPAKVLAGTTGSFLFGFLIAALSIFAGVKIATALLVLFIPVLDAVFVIFERIRAGVSPFHGGDGRHLHDKLRTIGWSDRRITVSYTAFSAVVAALTLSLPASGKAGLFLVLLLGFLFLLSVIRRNSKEKRYES